MIYGSVWIAAWSVLLIACVNLTNLTSARTLARSRELSTRIALGARQWRITQQVLAENLLLAAIGGMLAWWMSQWGVRVWAAATASRHQVLDYTIGYDVLAYMVAISVGAALLFSLVPIRRAVRLDVNGTLKGEARGATRGRRGKHFAGALVAGQMMLAIVLLSGTGVLVHSFWNVVGADVGVAEPDKVTIGRVTLPRDKYPTPEARAAFFGTLRSRLATVPGVAAASVSNVRPVDGTSIKLMEMEGQAGGVRGVSVLTAGTDYFRAVGATLLDGREFKDDDRPGFPRAAIVNQSFAAKSFPGTSALGKRLRLYDGDEAGEWITIVGVASNIMQNSPVRQQFLPLVYLPFAQQPSSSAWFFARARAPSDSVASAVRKAVQTMDPDLTLTGLSSLKASFEWSGDRTDRAHSEMGKYAAVAPIFAFVALLLAASGLYAVVAHSVVQRTKEIGIRIAVGATASEVRHLVMRQELLPAALGLVVGLIVSLGVNRVLRSQLVGVSPYDPATLAATAAILTVAALLACRIPLRRAVSVDPAIVLRSD